MHIDAYTGVQLYLPSLALFHNGQLVYICTVQI